MATQTAAQFGRRGMARPPPAKAAPAWRTTPPPPRPEPPRAARADSAAGPLLAVLFSFEGRLDRRLYRLCRICTYVSSAVIVWPLLETLAPRAALAGPLPTLALGLVCLGFVGALVWTTLAMQVKRWHDRDKSGFWAFVGFIPFIGWLWILIELNFIEGTVGPNRFGPSPRGDPSAVFA
jgi:uncharacterized membrane protein YhaH (DUF805 family)